MGYGLAKAPVGEPSQFVGGDEGFACGVFSWVLVKPDESRIWGGAAVKNRKSVSSCVSIDPSNVVG